LLVDATPHRFHTAKTLSGHRFGRDPLLDPAVGLPRAGVRRALELSSKAIILVHDHPEGDPTPLRANIEMTRVIVEVAELLIL
jgi:hypothetical protein